jgi:hypothetical protein
MPTNRYKPLGMKKSRLPQFSLRSMLVAVAALAILLSQYPFFEVVPVSGPRRGMTVNTASTEIVAPTRGFVLVFVGEIAVVVAWLGFRDLRVNWARRETRQLGGD